MELSNRAGKQRARLAEKRRDGRGKGGGTMRGEEVGGKVESTKIEECRPSRAKIAKGYFTVLHRISQNKDV